MNRRRDGTFTISFRTGERGAWRDLQTEEGRWTHSGERYVTVTTQIAGKPVDSSDPRYTDEYLVTLSSDAQVTYYNLGMKREFRSKRVPCDYKAP